MLEREIIKFYREKKGISQSVLAKGICGKSYISLFESGKLTISPKVICMLSDRLGIDINKEIELYNLIEDRLKEWNHFMIKQKSDQIEELRLELEKIPLIMYSKHASYYLLLKARYYLNKNMLQDTKCIIEHIEKEFQTLSIYEKNCLLHLKGMYSIGTFKTIQSEGARTALNYLKQINIDEYHNEEYYYHLALAYHHEKAKVLAYKNAQKAFEFFNHINNYVQAINSQIIMLMQFESGKEFDFYELVERYKDLILNCEQVGALESKIVLLNNLGEEYLKRKDYSQASKYFEQALLMTESSSLNYLHGFYNYVEVCVEGKLLDEVVLSEKIEEGFKLAKKQCPIVYTLFKLLSLKNKNLNCQYYNFLAEIAIPQFISTNNTFYYEKYGNILYCHYIELEEYKKATELDRNFTFFNVV